MRTRPLGPGGDPWSVIGLGSWAIGGPWARGWGEQDDAESLAAIHRALDAGVNWIDTAAVYGNGRAEKVIARALAERAPDLPRPLVLTKCGRVERPDGTVASQGSAASIRDSALRSLERLGRDRLDVMQLHWPPTDVPLEEAWTAIVDLRESGIVERIGVCNVDVDQFRAVSRIAVPELVQVPVSLVRREALGALVPECRAAGVGVIAYAPMQSGLLTGKYDATRIAALPDDDWRKRDPEFTGERLQRNLRLVERLRVVAAAHRTTPGEVAIAWVLHLAGVTGAIVGGRSAAQVEGWIGAAGLELSSAELEFVSGEGGDPAVS